MALGNIDKQYVSSIDFLDAREILNKALDIQNEDITFLDIMELTKRSVVTSENTYHHFVNEQLYNLGEVDSTSASDGKTITVTLTAATAGNCKAGDQVMFKTGRQGYVQKKDDAELTVISVDGNAFDVTTTGAKDVEAGDNLSFFSYAGAEGSGAPDPERWGLKKYSNQVQIFKGAWEITDIQKVSKIEVEYGGKPYIMYKGQHDAFRKFQANIGFAALLGIKSANNFGATSYTITDKDGKPVQTTKGLNQYIDDDGIQQNMDGAKIAQADLEDLELTFTKSRAPKSYEVYVPSELNIQYENFFHSLGNGSTLSDAGRYMITQNLDLGIHSFHLYGRDYHKVVLPMLDHTGVTNYDNAPSFLKSAFYVPMGKVKVDNGGDMVDRMRMRYMSGDGTNLRYDEVATGRLSGNNRTHEGLLKVSYVSVQGLEVLGANAFAKLTPTS